ncbi:MAG: 2-dehydropantoate 2-reductase [Luteolibacter sp.]
MHEQWTFRSVAIVGCGAIGLYYGGRLAQAGEDVRFLLRSDYEAVKENGLKIESSLGDFHLPDVQGFRSVEEIGPVDLVIVAWKATSNDLLPKVLPPLLHEKTQVLTLQNGLGNCEAIEEIVGPERVLGALCFVCINRLGPGFVRHTGKDRVSIGEWHAGIPGRAVEVTRRFQAAGIRAFEVPDLHKAQWEKLIWNIPFNGLAIAEGGVTTDVLLETVEPEIFELMTEVVETARKLGLPLEDSLISSNIERTRPMGAYRPSSMIDFVDGREVELSIWQQAIAVAKKKGVEMPLTEKLLERIVERIAERRLAL